MLSTGVEPFCEFCKIYEVGLKSFEQQMQKLWKKRENRK
jgi:hypothetical protein